MYSRTPLAQQSHSLSITGACPSGEVASFGIALYSHYDYAVSPVNEWGTGELDTRLRVPLSAIEMVNVLLNV